jgi:hypothetical protein
MKLQRSQILITILIASMAFSRDARAVSPPPDGGYSGGNTAEGQSALLSLTTGGYNTAVGFFALRTDATGQFNTALGAGTLLANTGDLNTASGAAALLSNTSGTGNTATGGLALFSNSTGNYNTAAGHLALTSNTEGIFNSAFGQGALASNTTGAYNSACGAGALYSNTNGSWNTASGFQTLESNTSGAYNTASGFGALLVHQTGEENNAFGAFALDHDTGGSGNNGIGCFALRTLATGDNNTAVGDAAGSNLTNGSGNVYIGGLVEGVVTESNHTYIRNINTTGLNGTNVTVDLNTGLLGHATSSRRYKEQIKPMEKSSDVLYRLKPVTYRYKKEIDPGQSRAFGLIAEDVAQVDADLVARNSHGEVETVRYEMVNAMLLNEFLKEHRSVQELKKEVATLTATVKEQAAQIQKVSSELKANRRASQIVFNTP